MRALIRAACFISCLGATAPALGQEADLVAKLSATLLEFRDRYGFPGATAAIALPNGVIVTAATGLADVETRRAMTPETPMLAASIGKTFVAATVLALESEGLLSQANLLSKHLGDRPWFAGLPNADTVTIGHLLRHTSGLPDYVYQAEYQTAWVRAAGGDGSLSPDDLVGIVIGDAPLFAAGTDRAYSDTGYILLGMVIERATGRPYAEVVAARFLRPLGLTGTFPSDRRNLPGLAVGYVTEANPFGLPARTADAEGRLHWDPAVEGTGGGLASTSHDLALWGHLLFAGKAMADPYLDRLLDGKPMGSDAPGSRYGTGIAIRSDPLRGPVYGHGGWVPAYVSSLRHYADHGVTVAFQINTDAGVMEGTNDLVPALEAALADLAIASVR